MNKLNEEMNFLCINKCGVEEIVLRTSYYYNGPTKEGMYHDKLVVSSNEISYKREYSHKENESVEWSLKTNSKLFKEKYSHLLDMCDKAFEEVEKKTYFSIHITDAPSYSLELRLNGASERLSGNYSLYHSHLDFLAEAFKALIPEGEMYGNSLEK